MFVDILNILAHSQYVPLLLNGQIEFSKPPVVLCLFIYQIQSGDTALLQQLHRPEVLPILLLQSCHPTLVQRLCRGKGFYMPSSVFSRSTAS